MVAAGGAAAILGGGDGRTESAVGSDEAGEASYPLAGFDRIAVSGPQEVEVSFGETFAIRAEGSPERIELRVEDGELVIRPRGGIRRGWGEPGATTVRVTMPRLTRVALAGAGDVRIDRVAGERFTGAVSGAGGSIQIDALDVEEAEFTIDGPGEIAAAGSAAATRVTVNGPGAIDAGDLHSGTAVVAVNGPGEVELTVEQEADVAVRGPGEVDIDGSPRCAITTAGAGAVRCGSEG